MLEWLLKYPLEWYADGHLGIAWGWQAYLLALVAAGVLVWLVGYRRIYRGRVPLVLRTLLAAVVLFALANPVLVVEAPGPVEGHVTVLLDDSLSMRMRDTDGVSRAERVTALFGNRDPADDRGERQGGLARSLGERIETRYFRFGEGLHPLPPGEPLRHADARSELGSALRGVVDGPDADSLAAVVVVSDGGNDAATAARDELETALQALRAAAVPVHVLASGSSPPEPDLELRAFRAPRSLLPEEAFEVDVEVVHRGLGGGRATLVIEDDGLIVDRHELPLPDDRSVLPVRRRLRLDTAGSRVLTARITMQTEESNKENNYIERSIEVIDEPIRVLHFEAEPRFEVKFVRRAVADDRAIRLTSLVRTADNKYYRTGVESAAELAQGFPTDPAELFRFHALIFGSVPAELLTRAQTEAIRDFVARRGGGLLLLGGRHAFAEGGHAGTVLGALTPVVLDGPTAEFNEAVQATPTRAGRIDPLLDFGDNENREALFQRLPPLAVINPHRQAKPGATVLLRGRDRRGGALILLASQRYGLGRVMSFPVRNSWRWQMHATIPPGDQTHELLWRQLLRDLGRNAGGRVRVTRSETDTTPGQPVAVRAQALDERYRPMSRGAVTLKVTTPLGEIHRYPMSSAAGGDGSFVGQFVPRETGPHDIDVELEEKGEVVGRAHARVDVSATGREYHAPPDGRATLERMASATGGALLEIDDADRLVDLVDSARGTRRELRRLPVWDAPVLLLLLLALACAEWVVRRRRNQA